MPKQATTKNPRNPALDVIRDLLITGRLDLAWSEIAAAKLTRAKRELVKHEAIRALLDPARPRVMEATLIATLGEVSTWRIKRDDGSPDIMVSEQDRSRCLAEYLPGDPVAHVGDILYTSWGYDQTNVDFYQVIRVSGKNAWIREISILVDPATQGLPQERVRPMPDAFVVPAGSHSLSGQASWRKPNPEHTPQGKRVLVQRSAYHAYCVRISDGRGYAYPTTADETHTQTGAMYGH